MASLNALNPIHYAFDPVGLTGHSHLEDNFPFLKEALVMEIPGLENSNCFNPRALGLPWPTTFPASVQSKHWRYAREAAHKILTEIRSTMKGSSKLGLFGSRCHG